MRSTLFRGIMVLLAVSASLTIATATAAAGNPGKKPPTTTVANSPANPPPKAKPPSTNQPFPTSTSVTNFPAGQITVRVRFTDSQVGDGDWAHYTLYVANRTPESLLFTKTAVAVGLDARAWVWSQTADNLGGFVYADAGHYWIRSGTLRPGRVIQVRGMVKVPNRTKYVQGNPMRDATIACIQAKVRQTIIGQPEKAWPETYSPVDRYSCVQYGS